MPSLHIRRVPDDVCAQIKALAAEDRRSLSAEALTLLEEALEERVRRRESIAALRRIVRRSRKYKAPPGAPDSVALIRENREPLPERVEPR